MTSTLHKTAVLALASCVAASAQPDMPLREQFQNSAVVSFEAIPFFSGDTVAPTVNVHYRIPERFFVVLRNPDQPGKSDFVARGELLTELRNKDGNSVAREIRSIVIRSVSLPRDEDPKPDLQGSFVLSAQPGTYTVWFSVDDMQSERRFTSRDQSITVRGPVPTGLDFSAPVLCFPSPDSTENPTYVALNRGTDVYFGEKGGLLFNVLASNTLQDLTVRYKVKHQPDYKGMEPQEFTGGEFVLHPGLARLVPTRDETFSSREPIRYVITPADSVWKSIFVPLPLEKLQPGRATLSLDFETGKSKRTLDRTLRVLWPDRPKSLINIDLAVDALQHIAGEEELERFRTFSNTRYVQALFNYWRKMDPDTTTAYNSVMTEYYRRVDVANERYSSTRGLDGYKSDRGRIYILYGSPTSTERLFSPQHPPREVWTYRLIKRRFVFEDQTKSGMYVLVAAEDL